MKIRKVKLGLMAAAIAAAWGCGGGSGEEAPDGGTPADAAAPADAPHGEAALSCPAGWAMCGDACVDLRDDANNCGACGTRCCGACNKGSCPDPTKPVTLASGLGGNSIVADGTYVYFTTAGDFSGAVMKVSRTGGQPVTLASAQAGPQGLVMDRAALYWRNDQSNALMTVPATGGVARELAPVTSGGALTVHGSSVYYGDGNDLRAIDVNGGTSYFVANMPSGVQQIAADDTYLYVSSDALYAVPLVDDGSRPTLAPAARALVVHGPHVFWTRNDDSTVYMAGANSSGLPSAQKITSDDGGAAPLASDGSNVYWIDESTVSATNTPPALVKAPAVPGSKPVTLARFEGLPGASGIAVDQACVYWVYGDTLFTMPK